MDAKILVEEINEKTGEKVLVNLIRGSYFIDNEELLKKYIDNSIKAFNETLKDYGIKRKLIEIEEINP